MCRFLAPVADAATAPDSRGTLRFVAKERPWWMKPEGDSPGWRADPAGPPWYKAMPSWRGYKAMAAIWVLVVAWDAYRGQWLPWVPLVVLIWAGFAAWEVAARRSHPAVYVPPWNRR